MRHYITDQHPDHLGAWVVCDLATGEVTSGATPSREVAVAALVAAGDFDAIVADAGENLIPWSGTIAFTDEPTDDKRQLDSGGGSFRTFPIPLMAQLCTSYGHDGAMIVGRMDAGTLGAEVTGSGVFDSSEWGENAARLVDQQMLDRVSIDLGAAEVQTEILEYDEDGWPTDWLDHFTTWQIAALTIVNVSAFADARISLDSPMPPDEVEPADDMPGMAAAVLANDQERRFLSKIKLDRMGEQAIIASIPVAAPADWFSMAEPQMGEPFALGGIGAEWLVEQNRAGAMAMPLHILDDGRVAGHIAYWGQCHVGFPGRCISPPEGDTYSSFHIGYHVADDGSTVATGTLTAGCDHAATNLRAPEATSHYAHNGVAWADVRITNGIYGPWACGVLRPDVTPEQIRVLRGGALSGDWRAVDGRLQMIATLAVNTPGFPIAREAITAAALEWFDTSSPRQRTEDGEVFALVASNQVTRCTECAKRAASTGSVEDRLAQVERNVKALRAVVRPTLAASAEFYRERIAASE